jgi:hypothetical protein
MAGFFCQPQYNQDYFGLRYKNFKNFHNQKSCISLLARGNAARLTVIGSSSHRQSLISNQVKAFPPNLTVVMLFSYTVIQNFDTSLWDWLLVMLHKVSLVQRCNLKVLTH